MSILTETATVPRLWFTPLAHEGGRCPASSAVLHAWRVPSPPFSAAWGSLHQRWPGGIEALLASQPSVSQLKSVSLCHLHSQRRRLGFTGGDLLCALCPLPSHFLWEAAVAQGRWIVGIRQHQVIKDLSAPISGLRNSLLALTPLHVAACP